MSNRNQHLIFLSTTVTGLLTGRAPLEGFLVGVAVAFVIIELVEWWGGETAE